MVNVTVVDERAPVEPTPSPSLSERVPLGAFVAYNGPSADGERMRAIVVGHGADDQTLELLNGPERVTLEDPTQVASVIVLAKSADGYAQRVSTKARALGRAHDWCDTANDAIAELNSTPEHDTDVTPMGPIKVRMTVTRDVVARPRRTRNRRSITPANLLAELQRAVYVGAELNYDQFQQLDGTGDVEVKLELVDEFSTNGDAASEA